MLPFHAIIGLEGRKPSRGRSRGRSTRRRAPTSPHYLRRTHTRETDMDIIRDEKGNLFYTLLNGVRIPAKDADIWAATNFSCTVHPNRMGVCLHEEPPKSLNPRWREQPETRYCVCNDCHTLVHSLSRADSAYFLNSNRQNNYPDAEALLWQLREKPNP